MFTDRPVIPLEAGEAMKAKIIGKLSASDPGIVEICDAADTPYGVITRPVEAGKTAAVVPFKAAIQEELIAGGTILLGEEVEVVDGGKVVKKDAGKGIGFAREGALINEPITIIMNLDSLGAGVDKIDDPAEMDALTTDLTGVDTGTDMTAAQAAQIEADLLAGKTGVDGNRAAIALIIDALEAKGISLDA